MAGTGESILVTGAAGFIGSNHVQYLCESRPDARIVALDALTYAGNMENLAGLEENNRFRFVKADIRNADALTALFEEESFSLVVHFAAESHVDRSIMGPEVFVDVNVRGTLVLLELARKHKIARFCQIGTDEVYGSLGPEGRFTEQSPIQPNSPYSASKAAADHLVRAYHHTFGLDTVITRCSNNYGPYQFPEKLIPLMILNCVEGKPLPVYGDGKNVRDWIHVRDHCTAVDAACRKGRAGEVYNIGSDNEWANIDIVKRIASLVESKTGKPRGACEALISYVTDRPGHDRRYAMDSLKLRHETGWMPAYDFDRGLADTVDWYLVNESWWRRIISGEYRDYYDKWYGDR
ncbi:MAG: dTDP-glucose 4,6-dehydratase [Deltaproteobacteria bacterium]|nr:dTDP-glucose 4,6-dehydratase [Deltaproteobacteria bacterium]